MNLRSFLLQQKDYMLEPVSTQWLGIFRISIFAQFLIMWYFLLYYQPLLGGEIWKFTYTPSFISTLLWTWFVVILFMIAGLFTRFASVVNYICVILICDISNQSHAGSYFNDIMKASSLLMMLMPIHHSYAVDKHLFKLPSVTPRFVYWAFLIATLGLIYTGAGLCKFFSKAWINGIGLWLPLSSPYSSLSTLTELLIDQKWLMYTINYVTIAWEVLFIPLLLWKRTYKLTILIGIIFHLGIVALFYLPKTALGVLSLYFVFGGAHGSKVSNPSPSVDLKNMNLYNKYLIGITVLLVALQAYSSMAYAKKMIARQGLKPNYQSTYVSRKIRIGFSSLNSALLGINSRSMFTDRSLFASKTWVGISRQTTHGEEWLKIINQDGRVGHDFQLNGNWGKIMQANLWEKGQLAESRIEHILRFWCSKNNLQDSVNVFYIYYKTDTIAEKFEYGHLQMQKNKPWIPLGSVYVAPDSFSAAIRQPVFNSLIP